MTNTILIAGVDEVGRGPLAGPVCAGAVILADDFELVGLTDSKKLSPKRREHMAAILREQSFSWALGWATPAEIDKLNIHHATLLAMQRAIEGLSVRPTFLRVDGKFLPKTTIPGEAVIKGDSKFACISAASVIAKVARDQYMDKLAEQYPGFGFEKHKGYPTPVHLAALKSQGPCPEHRRSFAPVQELIAE